MALYRVAKRIDPARAIEPESEKLIYVFGAQRLQNEVLAICLGREMGARCLIAEDVSQIASAEMQKNPEGADEVVSRTMRESSMASSSSASSSSRVALYISIILAVLGILIAAPILLYGASAADAMCSPAKPGL